MLPTRNRWALLAQSLAGALGQGSVSLEVIVVDEASSDETPARLAEIRDPRLRVVRHDSPRGPAAARNAGTAEASGEWIAFLDDDDLWAPHKLREQLRIVRGGVSKLAYCGRVEIDDRAIALRVVRPPRELGTQLLVNNVIGGPSNVLIDAGFLHGIGGFDERLWGLADWDLWLRAMQAGAAPSACREPLVAYRQHAGGMSRDEAKMLGDFAVLRDKHGEFAAEAGLEFGGGWLASWEAARDLTRGQRMSAAARYLRRALAQPNPRDLMRAAGAVGGAGWERRGRRAIARLSPRPPWLDTYG